MLKYSGIAEYFNNKWWSFWALVEACCPHCYWLGVMLMSRHLGLVKGFYGKKKRSILPTRVQGIPQKSHQATKFMQAINGADGHTKRLSLSEDGDSDRPGSDGVLYRGYGICAWKCVTLAGRDGTGHWP